MSGAEVGFGGDALNHDERFEDFADFAVVKDV